MKLILAYVLLPAVLLGTSVRPALAVHRQVFLLGGQSNMRGNGTYAYLPAAQPFADPLPEVRLYFEDPNADSILSENEWIALAPGSGSQFGPELTFGHAIHHTDPGGNYALIKYAWNGSNVSQDWNPNVQNNVYANFRSTVDAALQGLTSAGDTYEIVGMLWTQGIRDGKDGRHASQYQADLESLIADVRLNYRADLPVFISRLSINMTGANPSGAPPGGRGPTDYGLPGIRLGQQAVAANDPLAFLIDTDAFGIGDPAHFNSQGQVALGQAFAESYFQNFPVPEPSTLAVLLPLLGILAGQRWRALRYLSAQGT